VSYHQFQQLDVLLIETGSLVDQREQDERGAVAFGDKDRDSAFVNRLSPRGCVVDGHGCWLAVKRVFGQVDQPVLGEAVNSVIDELLLVAVGDDQRDLREVEKRLDRLDAERTHLVDQLTPVELPTVM